jgi:hypothetical protein
MAAVGGLDLPKRMAAVRRVSALAHVPGVTDLDPALTVGEHLHERALLERRFGGSVRTLLRPRRERLAEQRLRIDRALSTAGLDLAALPKGTRTAVRDLERLEALRLSLALALIGRPRLLGIDDTDLKLSDAERAEVWSLLGSLAASGTTVLAVCSEAPAGAVVVSTGTAAGGARADTTTGAAPEDTGHEDARREDAGQENGAPEDTERQDSDDDVKGAADALAETGRS